MSDAIAIVGAARTPMGGFQGELTGATASELGAVAIRAALERAGVEANAVDEVLMGCVLPAGQGQAPARQASFGAGLPKDVPCTTVNKMCGSGMKTVMMGMDSLRAGEGSVVVAGGMESMTNAPYVVPKMRNGARLGHAEMKDHMFLDGLEDAYDKGRLMGTFAEDCVESFQFTREAQDDYALSSLAGALKAQEEGYFEREITPVTIRTRKGEIQISADEQPRNARPDKIPTLKPAFRDGGTVTPANSSSISDGAAALVLMRESEAGDRPIRARIRSHASHAQEPGLFTTAPIPAIRKALDKAGWSCRGRRSLGDQRGLRRSPDGGDARPEPGSREGQREWWRLRPGPSHRRIRRADHRYPAARDGAPRPQEGRCQPVHRRWRGHGSDHRTGLKLRRWRTPRRTRGASS